MSKLRESLFALEKWFLNHQRILPWRNLPSDYRVWISEIMLQQTQVATVIPYFEKFIKRFPDVHSLAVAPIEEVMLYWSGLGYYSRARNLHKTAQIIAAEKKFPSTREEWVRLPGVGNYTAGAILSIARNLPEPILDGNVERVLARVRRIARGDKVSSYKSRLWRNSFLFVHQAFQQKIQPSLFNQALMELGATTCVPRKPLCLLCPLQGICRAFQAGTQDQFPSVKKKKEWKLLKEKVYCLVNKKGKILLRHRAEGEWRAGLWDFVDQDPLSRNPNFGGWTCVGKVKTRHIVTSHKIERTTEIWKEGPRHSSTVRGIMSCAEGSKVSDLKWFDPSTLSQEVPLGSAFHKSWKAVEEELLRKPSL